MKKSVRELRRYVHRSNWPVHKVIIDFRQLFLISYQILYTFEMKTKHTPPFYYNSLLLLVLPAGNNFFRPKKSRLATLFNFYNSRSISFNSCHGKPCLVNSFKNGSGLNSSTLNTPSFFHKPFKYIIAPTVAGTPVV